MPFAHKNLFQVRHWWLKLRYKRQDTFVFFTLQLEGLFPVLKVYFWKLSVKKVLDITPVEEFFFEVFSVFSSKGSFEEFVLRSLKASPLTKPLFTSGGWYEVKCVYWKVSVGLKFVCKSSAESQFFKSFGLAVYSSIQERRLCFLSTDIPYWKKCHPWIFSKRAVLCRFG